MKISREQKALNRRTLLNAGIELMSKEGLREATLRRIAQLAGMSEPVIYKYFPSKDHLLAAYFTETLRTAVARVEAQTDFTQQSFTGQLQLLIDALLAEYEKHRDFVREAYNSLFLSSLSGSLAYMAEEKAMFLDKTGLWLSAAVETGEFGEPPSRTVILELLWDFHLGLIYYWLKDDSDGGMRTLQLLDRSLKILEDLLKSNLLGRMADLFFFLAREHFMKSIDKLTELSDDQKAVKTRFFQGDGKKNRRPT
jgi:TetR/AcrR family transcriptional regulator of autoinduction and epiphytic fitness